MSSKPSSGRSFTTVGCMIGPPAVAVLLIWLSSGHLPGIVCVFAFLVVPTSLCLLYMVPRIDRRLSVIIISISCCASAALLYVPLARWWTSSGGSELSVDEAIARGLELPLPPDARNIEFRQHFHPETEIYVEFTISEPDFQLWVQERGWGSGDSLQYDNLMRGKPNIYQVGYEPHRRRAYYHFRSEPVYDD